MTGTLVLALIFSVAGNLYLIAVVWELRRKLRWRQQLPTEVWARLQHEAERKARQRAGLE